ncbi:MAG: hypothetical protein ACYDB0_00625 [Acidithiobacillus sp.]
MDLHDTTQFYYDCVTPHHEGLPVPSHDGHGKDCMVCGTRSQDYIESPVDNQAWARIRCPACDSFFRSWPRAFGKSGNFTTLVSKPTKGWVVVLSQGELSIFRNGNIKVKDSEESKGWPEIPDKRGLHPFVTRIDAPSPKAARFLAVQEAMRRLRLGQPVLVFVTNDKYQTLFGSIRHTLDAKAFFYGSGESITPIDMEKWFPRVQYLADFLIQSGEPGGALKSPKKKPKKGAENEESVPQDAVSLLRENVLNAVQAVTIKDGIRCFRKDENANLRKSIIGLKRAEDERSRRIGGFLLDWLNLPNDSAELVKWLIEGSLDCLAPSGEAPGMPNAA